jgi:fido (protein-threonine AMPylation protein)
MKTEAALRDWRNGPLQAERLCAGLLHIEGFESVDPQAPLGGPDGTKDLLCRKDGKKWTGAAYFPPTSPSEAAIKKKFKGDLKGVAKNKADGLVFLVNEPLSISQRSFRIKSAEPIPVVIYHLERIRALLDSPKGYGLRLEYLRIAMTMEEQLAFWSAHNYDTTRHLLSLERSQISIAEKLDAILERGSKPVPGTGESDANMLAEEPMRVLNLAMLCWIHRIVMSESPLTRATPGRLRSVQNWIGKADGTVRHYPPSPQEVPHLTINLIKWWNELRPSLAKSNVDQIIAELAKLHHSFLSIHPFLDGNGRVARVILDQAARELLGKGVGEELTSERQEYYDCLSRADSGDFGPLTRRIEAALS